jgi:TP53 regulating kinase-like protein
MEVEGGEKQLEMLGHGAEARVWKSTFCGRPCVIKERVEKKYRHPQLEAALSKKRLNQEARCIARARKSGVPAPCIYHIAHDTKRIYMSLVDGPTLKAWLVGEPAAEDVGVTMRAVGACVAKLHDADLIHGDLTSSNIMLIGDAPFIIDFGLACVANLPEVLATSSFPLIFYPPSLSLSSVLLSSTTISFLSIHTSYNGMVEAHSPGGRHGGPG